MSARTCLELGTLWQVCVPSNWNLGASTGGLFLRTDGKQNQSCQSSGVVAKSGDPLLIRYSESLCLMNQAEAVLVLVRTFD